MGGVAGYSRDPIRVDEWRPDIALSTTARDYALAYNAAIRRARCDAGWSLEFAVPLVAALDSPVRLVFTLPLLFVFGARLPVFTASIQYSYPHLYCSTHVIPIVSTLFRATLPYGDSY